MAFGHVYSSLMATDFHLPIFGRERLNARTSISRHRHFDGYVTIILAGGYQEAGFDGRRHLVAGNVVVHRSYDAHLDHIGVAGAELINLPLPSNFSVPVAFRIDDPDTIARLAERDPLEAVLALRPNGEVPAETDWPDRLASDLMEAPAQRLEHWADTVGLAPETLSRGFRVAYGITPARFRVEVRARRAMEMIHETDAGLAAIAADCGYADQPHLNRAIVELTGRPPGIWRRSNSFKSSEHSLT
jgi:AraC-like DNA-binding protein